MNEQFGFDLGEAEAPATVRPHAIRLELNALIDAVIAATDGPPWDDATLRHYRTIFPIKAKVLPPDEARFLWRKFEYFLGLRGVPSES